MQQNTGLLTSRRVYGNKDYVIPPHRPPIAQMGKVHHQAHMMYEEDDDDLDGARSTRALVYLCYLQE